MINLVDPLEHRLTMDTSIFSAILAHYHWQATLYVLLGITLATLIGKQLLLLIPTIRQAQKINKQAADSKMAREYYAANQKRNKMWGTLYSAILFLLGIPFCTTLQFQSLADIALDVFVILMVYDFFYYLTHRFLFHDAGPFRGPLMWMHAVHHQQNNPCRLDSSYIHPLEVAIGMGLYIGTILLLAIFMGDFHVATIVITWIAFMEINQHNHDLWVEEKSPYKYLNYLSKMHHVHHAKFTGGNFATISLLYDWLFGTYDTGEGYKKK